MTRSLRLAGAVACVLAALARPGGADPLSPGTRLCLHPVTIPVADSEEDERRLALQRLLVGALTAADFRVADPEEVERVSTRVFEAAEGWVDPATGRRIEARHRAYVADLARALGEELGCELRATAHVVPVRARFEGGIARWDGETRQVSSTGRIVLQALGGTYESGWIGALSLWLDVTDLEGGDVAFRSAAIETLVRLGVVVDQDLVPEDVWLTDEQKVRGAIASALGPGGEHLRRRGTPRGARRR